jgi:hypothetical protein
MSRYETDWIPSMDTTTRLQSTWIEEPGKTSQEINGEVMPQVSKERNCLTARKFTGNVHSLWVPKGGKI